MEGILDRMEGQADRARGTRGTGRAAVASRHPDVALWDVRRWTSEEVVLAMGANVGHPVMRLQEPQHPPRIVAFWPAAATRQELFERIHRPIRPAPQRSRSSEERRAHLRLQALSYCDALVVRAVL